MVGCFITFEETARVSRRRKAFDKVEFGVFWVKRFASVALLGCKVVSFGVANCRVFDLRA